MYWHHIIKPSSGVDVFTGVAIEVANLFSVLSLMGSLECIPILYYSIGESGSEYCINHPFYEFWLRSPVPYYRLFSVNRYLFPLLIWLSKCGLHDSFWYLDTI